MSLYATGLSLLPAAVLLVMAGCAAEKPAVAEVSGVITMDGKPMELIHVEFWPDKGPRSFGKSDENGKYTLKTDDHSQVGAAVGMNKILLRDTWPAKDDYLSDGGDWVDMSKGKKNRIDSAYYDVSTTTLSADVKPGQSNTVDLAIKPARK